MSTEKVNDDLAEVQAQCKLLGLEFHHRNNVDTLKAQIGAYLLKNPAKAGLLLDGEELVNGAKQWPIDKNAKALTPEEYAEFLGPVTRKTVGALRRVKIMCMNPQKREWLGEIISVGSAKWGTFKKFIPFDGQPYHIPQIMYDMLKERKCTVFHTEKQKEGRGGDIRKGRLIPEFNIVDLPPLTEKELKTLADQQALAAAGL